MENTNYINFLNRKRISLYHISEETGIPYTTLSKLKLGKLDMNKCSAEVSLRLARFFECSIEDLLNPYSFMAGVHGTYRCCHYRWVSEAEDDVLYVKEGKADIEIDRNMHITNFKYRGDADVFTHMAIDIYIKKKEADVLCRSTS